jgi:hypothetical protein
MTADQLDETYTNVCRGCRADEIAAEESRLRVVADLAEDLHQRLPGLPRRRDRSGGDGVTREAARVEQLREAARVLTDRAAVMERGR